MAMRGQPTNAESYGRAVNIATGTPFPACDAIVVLEGGGDATITLLDGDPLSFTLLIGGDVLPLRATQATFAAPTRLAALYW